MGALDDVKKWMDFFGWKDGGGPGSVKLNANGAHIAKHGDAAWIADVEKAAAKSERERLVAEIERRERLGVHREQGVNKP